MRLDAGALEDVLARCERERQPVLMAVAVLGTTEYGTVDPVDAMVDARDRWAAKGLGFSVHVDGAWGGYLATLFRNRSEEHTSELQSLMRISYAVFCLKKKKKQQ